MCRVLTYLSLLGPPGLTRATTRDIGRRRFYVDHDGKLISRVVPPSHSLPARWAPYSEGRRARGRGRQHSLQGGALRKAGWDPDWITSREGFRPHRYSQSFAGSCMDLHVNKQYRRRREHSSRGDTKNSTSWIWECQQAIPGRAELSRPCFAVLGVTPGSPLVGCNFTCISEPQPVETRISPIGRRQPISPPTPERSLRSFVTIDRGAWARMALAVRYYCKVYPTDVIVTHVAMVVVARKAFFPRAPTLTTGKGVDRGVPTYTVTYTVEGRGDEGTRRGLALGSSLA